MFGHRSIKPPEHEPLVTDRHGQVVGISIPPPSPPEETKASRLWHRRRNLAKTGEMRSQAALRNQFAVFHVDPPATPRR
jgi:hypothetical protein